MGEPSLEVLTDPVVEFMQAVAEEARRAVELHGEFQSLHEAYAVTLEEMDEFKAEVWKRTSERDLDNLRTEMVQLAAMAYKTTVLIDRMQAAGQ